MKLSYQLPIAIASVAIATSNISAAQAPEGRIHNVTVSLEATFEGVFKTTAKDETDDVYEESVKIVTEKISNKQVLEALKDDGLITEIKGYSIVMLTDSDADILGVWLRKDKELVENISGYFDADIAPVPPIEGYKGSYKNNKGQNLYQSTDDTITLGSVGFEIAGLSFSAQGLVQLKTAYTDDDGNETTFVKTGSFSDLTGPVNEAPVIITGGIKAGEGAKYAFPTL
jgi:hypothetical protein